MKNLIISILITLFFCQCSQRESTIEESKEIFNQDKEQWIIEKHQFSHEFFNAYLENPSRGTVNEKVKGSIKLWLSMNDNFSAFLYKEYESVKGIKPMIIAFNSMARNSFVLLLLDSENKVMSFKEITSSICDVIDQDDEKEVIWCGIEKASFINSKLFTTRVRIKEFDYGKYSTFDKDSINSIYEISKDGLLILTHQDSIRLNYRKDEIQVGVSSDLRRTLILVYN